MEGYGVRCVSTGDWVTAAETAECVLTLDALGMDDAARELFTAAQGLRLPDGSYWTGMVFPDRVTFPDQETTTYTGQRSCSPLTHLPAPRRPPVSSGASGSLRRWTWPSQSAPAAPRWTAPQGPETGCCTGLALGPELRTAARTLPSDELAVL